MTDEPILPDDPRLVVSAPNGNGMTVADVTGLIALMADMLNKMEGRIIDRLNINAEGAKDRWVIHDRDAAIAMAKVDEEIALLRADLAAHLVVANVHFDKERTEEIASDARVRPVRTTLAWIIEHWGQILLFLFGVLGFFAIAADVIARYIGGGS